MAQQSYPSSATVASSPLHPNSQPYGFTASPPIPLQAVVVAATNVAAQQLSEKDKKQKAWKYEGYKEFSKWMASDDDCFVIRRFHGLNAHVILYLQDRIVEIEEKLDEIHKKNASDYKDTRRNSSFRWDRKCEPERDRLMRELADLLHQYSMLYATKQATSSLPCAKISMLIRIREFARGQRRRGARCKTFRLS